MRNAAAVAVVTALVIAGASSVHASDAHAQETSTSVWLCRPGLADNPCESSLTTTVQRADGSDNVQRPRGTKQRPVDCFYVYPTVSGQPGTNADLTIDPEQIAVAQTQASRFSQVCRVFAPMYPQLTVAAIRQGGVGGIPAGGAKAFVGVLSAWRDYLEHDNNGRGVVLIGHSQGTAMLTALLRREIEPDPAQLELVVSALLIGGNVTVPVGEDVGGSFMRVPACRTPKQTGCVVAYSAFAEEPPAVSMFGRVAPGRAALPADADPGAFEVLCVNPADVGGTQPKRLQSYFGTQAFPGPVGAGAPSQYDAPTPWVELPNLYTGHCENRAGASWLQIDDLGGAGDERPRVAAVLGPTWGLHLFDVNLALGDLVDLARRQVSAYRRAHA